MCSRRAQAVWHHMPQREQKAHQSDDLEQCLLQSSKTVWHPFHVSHVEAPLCQAHDKKNYFQKQKSQTLSRCNVY